MATERLTSPGRATAILRDLVAIESVNPYYPGGQRGEVAMAAYVSDFFRRLGLHPETQEVLPGRNNVWARLDAPRAPENAKTLLLESHMDTVTLLPAGPSMLDPVIRNGRMFGRGSCDTKASLAAMLAAAESLVHRADELSTRIIVLGSVDEEYLMRGIRAFVASGPRVDAAIVGEPTRLQVVRAHKGLMRWEIHTNGRSAHTSVPHEGDNAIYQMVEVVQTLRDELTPRLNVHVHPLLGHPTLVAAMIAGGTGVNVVPDRCTIRVDRRMLPNERPVDVDAELREALAALQTRQPEVKVEVPEPFLTIGGLDTSADEKIVQVAASVVERFTGSGEIVGVPYGTNASALADDGVPTVVLGPGDIAQAHTANEWVDQEQVETAAEIYAAIALA